MDYHNCEMNERLCWCVSVSASFITLKTHLFTYQFLSALIVGQYVTVANILMLDTRYYFTVLVHFQWMRARGPYFCSPSDISALVVLNCWSKKKIVIENVRSKMSTEGARAYVLDKIAIILNQISLWLPALYCMQYAVYRKSLFVRCKLKQKHQIVAFWCVIVVI